MTFNASILRWMWWWVTDLWMPQGSRWKSFVWKDCCLSTRWHFLGNAMLFCCEPNLATFAKFENIQQSNNICRGSNKQAFKHLFSQVTILSQNISHSLCTDSYSFWGYIGCWIIYKIREIKASHTQNPPTPPGMDKTELLGKKGVKKWPEFSDHQGIILCDIISCFLFYQSVMIS